MWIGRLVCGVLAFAAVALGILVSGVWWSIGLVSLGTVFALCAVSRRTSARAEKWFEFILELGDLFI